MIIIWRDPRKELPKVGQIVWILEQHWKAEGAQNCEIMAGEVCLGENNKLFILNNDYVGSGYLTWAFPEDEVLDGNHIAAWAPAEDSILPEWLNKS